MQGRRAHCFILLFEERTTPPKSEASERQMKKLKCKGKAEWIRLSYSPRIEAALLAAIDSDTERKIVGANVKAIAIFPVKLLVGGVPIRPQAKTRRDASIVEEVVPVGRIRRYDSAPGIRIGEGS